MDSIYKDKETIEDVSSNTSPPDELNSFSSSMVDFTSVQNYSSPIKESFKVGRQLEVQRTIIENNLMEQYRGTITIGGNNVSSTTIKRVNIALAQALYNTSIASGNEKENTGLVINGTLFDNSESAPLQIGNTSYQYGQVIVKVSELATYAFGVDKPTNKQKKDVYEALKVMQSNGVTVTYPNGDKQMRSLVWIRGYDKIGKAMTLDLMLNPIYTLGVFSNFSEYPQDIMKRLVRECKQVTDAHIDLLSLLSIQDKRKPFYIRLTTLIEKLGLVEEYKNTKNRTIEKLDKLFESMVNVGVLQSLPKIIDKKGEVELCFQLATRENLLQK